MSKEYIERKSLIEDCNAIISNIQFTSPYQDDIDTIVSGMERIRDMIDEAPIVDVAPVVHGEWIPIVNYFHGKPTGKYYCSVCHRVEDVKGIYCRLCGARMDGGNKNV
jgi:hypothetical protein